MQPMSLFGKLKNVCVITLISFLDLRDKRIKRNMKTEGTKIGVDHKMWMIIFQILMKNNEKYILVVIINQYNSLHSSPSEVIPIILIIRIRRTIIDKLRTNQLSTTL
ncbi:Hypothetical_protein [Hexamita inflata]|uniref:Hypothetical_protein n=1 Tax=Hexamita inflata TaxID=28002 RepID=A0AA86P808_9EUKA|nr:Hypothetical protein HINF_LOCUS21020 [Hexamita inflata]